MQSILSSKYVICFIYCLGMTKIRISREQNNKFICFLSSENILDAVEDVVKDTNKSRTKQQIHLFFVERKYIGRSGIRCQRYEKSNHSKENAPYLFLCVGVMDFTCNEKRPVVPVFLVSRMLSKADSNHHKQNQNLLCYHYTIGQSMVEKLCKGSGFLCHYQIFLFVFCGNQLIQWIIETGVFISP